MDRKWFESVVDETLEALPDWVASKIDNLHVIVEAEPRQELGDVLGLYEGVSLLERSGDYWGVLPDRITVFMGPHLRIDPDPDRLRDEVRKTVLHELAHHLGIDDARLSELGWD